MNKVLKITNNIKCVIGDINSHNENLAAYTKKSNSEEGKSLLIFPQTFNGGVIVLNQESNLSSKDHQTINLKTITENSKNCDALVIENASQFLKNNNCDLSIRTYDSFSAILYDEKNDILVPIHLGRMAIINGVIGNVFDKMQTLYNDRSLDFKTENFKVEFFAGLLVQNHELKVSDLKGIVQNIIQKNPNDEFDLLQEFYSTGFFRHFYNKEEFNEGIKLTGYIKSRNFKDFEEFKKELTSEINDDDKKTNIYFDPVGLALDRIYESFGENINISTEHLHDTKSDLNFKSKRRIDNCLRILEMILNNKVDNTENLKKEVLDFSNMISHTYEYNYDTKSYNEMKDKCEIIIKKNIIDLSSSIISGNESDKKIRNLKKNLDNNDEIYNFFKKEIIELINRSSDLFKGNLLKAFQDELLKASQDKQNTKLNKLEDSLKELNIDNESEKNYSFKNLIEKFTEDNDKEFDSIIFNIIKNDYPKLEQDDTKRSNHNIIYLVSIDEALPPKAASINNQDSSGLER